jgi:hypothetical protein
MYSNFDFRGLVWLAVFGAICAAIGGCGVVGAIIWFIAFHVRLI